LAKILDYDVSEVIGKSIYNYIQDDFKELVEKNIYKKISGEVKSTSYEIVMLKKGGEPVRLRTFGNRTENGHVTITGSIIQLED
jgi:PAS domain S-box-containing protein